MVFVFNNLKYRKVIVFKEHGKTKTTTRKTNVRAPFEICGRWWRRYGARERCSGARKRCPEARKRCSGTRKRCSGARKRCSGTRKRCSGPPGAPLGLTDAALELTSVVLTSKSVVFQPRATLPDSVVFVQYKNFASSAHGYGFTTRRGCQLPSNRQGCSDLAT